LLGIVVLERATIVTNLISSRPAMARLPGHRLVLFRLGFFLFGATLVAAAAGGGEAAARQAAVQVRTASFPSLAYRQEWVLSPATSRSDGYVGGGQLLTLRSVRNGFQAVVYQKREYGINLSWAGRPPARIRLLPDPAQRDTALVRHRTRVAIEVTDGGYLKYREREYGINLDWSQTPAYEWEVRGDGIVRLPTRAGMAVGLFNTVANDYVVYCEREYGINLRWARDCDDLDEGARLLVSMRVRLPSSASAATRCAGVVRIELRPVALESGAGKRDSFTFETVIEDRQEYPRAFRWPNTGLSWWCSISDIGERLAPGMWRAYITVTSWSPNPRGPGLLRPWTTACSRTISGKKPLEQSPGNVIRLTFDAPGCGEGNNWPPPR
jgi:hypothetical protein